MTMYQVLGLFALLLQTAACASPYVVTRQLRGSGNKNPYYVYPPGSHPSRPLKLVEPMASKATADCAARTIESPSFTMRFRNGRFRSPAIVLRDRGALPKSRDDFNTEVATLLAGVGDCLSRQQTDDLKDRLWGRMPKTFLEDLYDRYRFDTLNRTIDLQAGMRLRFDWQAFDFNSTLPSYTGSGVSYALVARRPHRVDAGVTSEPGLLTFESFLSWTNTTIDRTSVPRVAGALDLEGPLLARKYYRLVLPQSFAKSAAVSIVSSTRAVLLGANSLEDLEKAEQDLANCGNAPADPTRPICTVVAGRTLVVPEVVVDVNAAATYLPVGMTLRQLVDRGPRVWTPGGTIPLWRYHLGRLAGVVFLDADEDALDLPLVKGDRVRW